jgi:hypothetical protein
MEDQQPAYAELVAQIRKDASKRKEDAPLVGTIFGWLEPYSDAQPARYSLAGVFNLVYSDNQGPPSGCLVGPLYGRVTQKLLDNEDKTYINTVKTGPVEILLQAEKTVRDDWTNGVCFRQARLQL